MRRDDAARRSRLEKRQDELTTRIEAVETRVREIDGLFCEADYYERTPTAEVRALEQERAGLEREEADLMAEWEKVEKELHALS